MGATETRGYFGSRDFFRVLGLSGGRVSVSDALRFFLPEATMGTAETRGVGRVSSVTSG